MLNNLPRPASADFSGIRCAIFGLPLRCTPDGIDNFIKQQVPVEQSEAFRPQFRAVPADVLDDVFGSPMRHPEGELLGMREGIEGFADGTVDVGSVAIVQQRIKYWGPTMVSRFSARCICSLAIDS